MCKDKDNQLIEFRFESFSNKETRRPVIISLLSINHMKERKVVL